MTDPEFGPREGETAIALPASFDAGVYFIGRIRTPWTTRAECPKNGSEAEAACTIELDPRYADGLADLATCSHLIVLYWMDRAPRHLVRQRPRLDRVARGVFALRSPARPNPIALSVVALLQVEGTAVGARARLPRRHAAPRPQALFRLDRCKAAGARRLARREGREGLAEHLPPRREGSAVSVWRNRSRASTRP